MTVWIAIVRRRRRLLAAQARRAVGPRPGARTTAGGADRRPDPGGAAVGAGRRPGLRERHHLTLDARAAGLGVAVVRCCCGRRSWWWSSARPRCRRAAAPRRRPDGEPSAARAAVTETADSTWKGSTAAAATSPPGLCTARTCRSRSGQVEVVLQAHGQARVVGHGADAGDHAGHERGAVQGVVADRRGSPPATRAAPPGARPGRGRAGRAPGCRRRRRRGRRRGRWPWRRAPGRARPPRRAAAMSCAVRRAVPEGASALSGWCSSTISTDSKYGAASSANRIISNAPMEKFGAIEDPDAAARRRATGVRSRAAPRRSRWCRRPRGCRGRCRARGCPSPRRDA